MTKVIITGSNGQMGQALLACAARNPRLQVVGQIDLGDDIRSVIESADVVVDFSFHKATPEIATLCARNQKALVVGTTGHSSDEKAHITGLSSKIPIVWSANYSTGVNAL